MDMFLGEKIDFWLELKRQSNIANTRHLISEIAALRAKVSFYESRIADMELFRTQNYSGCTLVTNDIKNNYSVGGV